MKVRNSSKFCPLVWTVEGLVGSRRPGLPTPPILPTPHGLLPPTKHPRATHPPHTPVNVAEGRSRKDALCVTEPQVVLHFLIEGAGASRDPLRAVVPSAGDSICQSLVCLVPLRQRELNKTDYGAITQYTPPIVTSRTGVFYGCRWGAHNGA